MKIMQFVGAAVVATMLGSSLALATTIPAQQAVQPGVSQQKTDPAALPVLANNAPRSANVLNAPQVTQQPKTLPLANFGQWDEAASEN